MGGKKMVIECFKIGNVYHPFMHKVNNKKTPYDEKWLKALASIKAWN